MICSMASTPLLPVPCLHKGMLPHVHRPSLLLGPSVTLPSSPHGMGKQSKTSQPVSCCHAGFAPLGTNQSHRQRAQRRGALKRSQPGGEEAPTPAGPLLHQHPRAGGCGRAGCGKLELPALPARGSEEGYLEGCSKNQRIPAEPGLAEPSRPRCSRSCSVTHIQMCATAAAAAELQVSASPGSCPAQVPPAAPIYNPGTAGIILGWWPHTGTLNVVLFIRFALLTGCWSPRCQNTLQHRQTQIFLFY